MQVLRLLSEARLGRCCHRNQSRVYSHVRLFSDPRLHFEALCQVTAEMDLGEGEQGLDGPDQAGSALHRHVVVRMRSVKIARPDAVVMRGNSCRHVLGIPGMHGSDQTGIRLHGHAVVRMRSAITALLDAKC
jgi:hypothetical protein